MVALLDVSQEQTNASSGVSSLNDIPSEDGAPSHFSKLLQGITNLKGEETLPQKKSLKVSEEGSKQTQQLPKNIQELLAVVGDDEISLQKKSQKPQTLEDIASTKAAEQVKSTQNKRSTAQTNTSQTKTLEDLMEMHTSKKQSLKPSQKSQLQHTEISKPIKNLSAEDQVQQKEVKPHNLEGLLAVDSSQKESTQERKKTFNTISTSSVTKDEMETIQTQTKNSSTFFAFTQQEVKNSEPQKMYVASLVADAKSYIQDKINVTLAQQPQTKQPQKMPQTLQGLVDYAKELKIDISKVSVDEFAQKGTKAIAEGLTPKEMPKSSKLPASFQAQISTQEIVHTKKIQVPQQNVAKGSILTADFSVQTARVIAPKEHILQDVVNEKEFVGDEAKTQTTQTLKNDSLEVKMNEAKQMVKYLSQDVKTAIDNYKSPFTRVKVQLNPQNLGEMEVTVVQRGKNLHVSLSSNTTALNTLAMNVGDLKMQLQHNGIQNASVHFNSNAQQGFDTSGGNNSNAQQQHNRQQAQQEYSYFDVNEENEEILDSIEIIVPNYA